MSVRNLNYLFEPKSVTVIGASNRPRSVGATVLYNLIESGFSGPILPVNLKHEQLEGLPVYRRVADLPQAPDLAVLCTPAATIPGLIRELGERGTRAAIVLSAGLGVQRDAAGITLKQAMLDAARPYLLRILGPNCIGLLIPALGLNASFAHTSALPGKIAFVSQSGALVTAVLDWARSRQIGFSKFISLGESADVDFGDVLDYLASDAQTRAILLYIEDIRDARKFMSAARAAGRSKATVVIKAGRVPEGARAAASHTGAMAGSDAVYDAAFRRAGMLRVMSTEDLFAAVETLARARRLTGDTLTIITNGGGPGVMATDALVGAGGRLANLSDLARDKLDAVLPATWSHSNPIDLLGDAPVARYVQAMEAVLQDPATDAVLFLHAPTAIVPSAEIAAAVAPLVKTAPRNILASWLGGEAVARAREIFSASGIPNYDTPEEAVNAFMQMVQYRRNQDLLMQVPPSLPEEFAPDRAAARAVVEAALAQGRQTLTEPEAKALLAAYGIPVVQTQVAATVEAAVACAQGIGFPVALKILSPQISHKSDVGGVVLDLESAEAVRSVATRMERRLRELRPDAQLQGFTVQAMARRPESHELIVGASTDPVFGPVILFGQGGIAVEVMDDHALGLPPLNMVLARDLVSRTRVSKLLKGYRNRAPADLDAVCRVLIRVSHLVTDIAELAELDINPLLADGHGVIALDARASLVPTAAGRGVERLAIRPYPKELEQTIAWQGESLLLRPIRPEDGTEHDVFFHALDPEDVRLRLFTGIRELLPSQLARMTQIDYDREMAFIATRKRPQGGFETLGVARAVADPDNLQAEFAIIVRSDLKGKGLGRILMERLIAYCKSRGTGEIVGEALARNRAMIDLVKQLGFEVRRRAGEDTVLMRLKLGQE